MARPLRIEYEGALYHIAARGNEKNPVYRDVEDYNKFLKILSDLPQRYGVIIHGYVLMGNHYHLLIETPKGNIARAMHYLNTTYTGYFNRKYKRAGHLFQGRYKGLLIEKERYLLSVSRYIHLNPVRAKVVGRPEAYKWSSYPEYIGRVKKKEWLTHDWILRQYNRNEAKARSLYKKFLEEGVKLKDNPFEDIKAGVILGSEGFIDEIKKKINLKKHREIPESRKLIKEIQYKDVIRAVSKRFKIHEEEIRGAGRRNNLARKICLYYLRRLTDMSNEEISGFFGIGYTAVSQTVSRLKKDMEKDKELKKAMQKIERKILSEE
jgi:REP element-mobilizing transposase RayT